MAWGFSERASSEPMLLPAITTHCKAINPRPAKIPLRASPPPCNNAVVVQLRKLAKEPIATQRQRAVPISANSTLPTAELSTSSTSVRDGSRQGSPVCLEQFLPSAESSPKPKSPPELPLPFKELVAADDIESPRSETGENTSSEIRPKKARSGKSKRKKKKAVSLVAVSAAESGQACAVVPRAKLSYVVQFGNNSPLIRQLMRNRSGWAAGPGDPGNLIGKIDYEEKRVKVQISDDFPEVQFLWTQYSESKFFDAIAAQEYGVCVTLNEEHKMQFRQKTPKQEAPLAPVARAHNHFEGNGALCTKRGLCESMVSFFLGHRRDPFGAIPLTFVLRDGSRDNQFEEFRKAFDDIEASSGHSVWLVKPAEWSNRGMGIRLFDSFDEVERRVNSKEQTWVVQKYIEHPLLIHRRKFDIRSYCLVSQEPDGGELRAYFYREAYLRTTSAEYTTKTLDRMVHLNNDAVQKKGEDYGKFESANKLSLDDLQRYLNEHNATDGINVKDHIVPQMQSLMTDVLKSVVDRLNPRKLDHCFEVYGFDFMIDVNYRVWLIEVNTNPCLELSCAYLEQLIPKMLDEAFQLTIDRIFPQAAMPQHQAQHGCSSRSSAVARNRDLASGTGWEQIFSSVDSNLNEVSCDWVPHLTETKVDVAFLGRDILGLVRRPLPQPPPITSSTCSSKIASSAKHNKSGRAPSQRRLP